MHGRDTTCRFHQAALLACCAVCLDRTSCVPPRGLHAIGSAPVWTYNAAGIDCRPLAGRSIHEICLLCLQMWMLDSLPCIKLDLVRWQLHNFQTVSFTTMRIWRALEHCDARSATRFSQSARPCCGYMV